MATHSKICPFRALTPPHRSQNRHNLGNPPQYSHPCDRPLREKTHRFYGHLGFALELFFGISHHFCVAVAKFRSSAPNDLLGFTPSPNQAADSTSPDNQRPHRAFPLVYQQDFIYKSVTHIQNVFAKKTKEKTNRRFEFFFRFQHFLFLRENKIISHKNPKSHFRPCQDARFFRG